jgi:hypothetical protein
MYLSQLSEFWGPPQSSIRQHAGRAGQRFRFGLRAVVKEGRFLSASRWRLEAWRKLIRGGADGAYDFGMRRRFADARPALFFPGQGCSIRRATGSEQLRLGKLRSLWNQIGAASNLGFVVWVVYGILYALGHWTAAAVAGLAVMLAIVASENRTANVKILDLTSLGFLVLALTMLLTVGDQVFNRYHITLVWGLFALLTWSTILVGFPFTLQLAWERAPRKVWSEALFHRVHFRLTTVWGVIFTLDTALAIVALGVSYVRMMSVIIPGASMIFGYAFSRIFSRVTAVDSIRKRDNVPRRLERIGARYYGQPPSDTRWRDPDVHFRSHQRA